METTITKEKGKLVITLSGCHPKMTNSGLELKIPLEDAEDFAYAILDNCKKEYAAIHEGVTWTYVDNATPAIPAYPNNFHETNVASTSAADTSTTQFSNSAFDVIEFVNRIIY